MTTSKCKSCGAAIVWCRTPGGRKMPVDAEPVANGNLCLQGDGVPVAAVVSLPNEPTTQPRYLSHFVTCPQHAEWRKSQ